MLHALAIAALLILAHGPQALMDISFQLSFISVLAIALVLRWKQGLGQELPQTDEPLWRKARRWLIDYAWLTAGVTLATLPLVAYYFNQVAWLGLWANLIVVPFAGFILVPLGLLSAFTLLIFGGSLVAARPVQPELVRLIGRPRPVVKHDTRCGVACGVTCRACHRAVLCCPHRCMPSKHAEGLARRRPPCHAPVCRLVELVTSPGDTQERDTEGGAAPGPRPPLGFYALDLRG